MQRKRVPSKVKDWKQMVPPNLEYDYFAAAGEVPFDPTARGFCPRNASWLADMALLAYAPPDFAAAHFERGLGPADYFERDGTRAYVVQTQGAAIAAFRGTEAGDPRQFIIDLKDDLNIKKRPGAGVAGHVHRGFELALDDIWTDVERALRPAVDAGKSIWLTGHSLGAALATLAAARLGKAAGVYVFACPRVGDVEFAAAVGQLNLIRFVNGRDVVPRLPPRRLGFVHAGRLMMISADGKITEHAEPQRMPEKAGVKDVAKRWKEAALLNPFDHPQVLYATHLWNAFVEGR